MKIGVDFDNTIVGYDRLFARLAAESGLNLDPVSTRSKRALRDRLRTEADGESTWRRLQALAYGPRIGEAILIEGVVPFFKSAHKRGVPCVVVSHKSHRAAAMPDGVDLQEAALGWIDQQGLFDDPAIGLSPDKVYFEPTRSEKIARIATLGVTHFIDDLVETFAEPSFPAGIDKILFSPEPPSSPPVSLHHCATWEEIGFHLFGREP